MPKISVFINNLSRIPRHEQTIGSRSSLRSPSYRPALSVFINNIKTFIIHDVTRPDHTARRRRTPAHGAPQSIEARWVDEKKLMISEQRRRTWRNSIISITSLDEKLLISVYSPVPRRYRAVSVARR